MVKHLQNQLKKAGQLDRLAGHGAGLSTGSGDALMVHRDLMAARGIGLLEIPIGARIKAIMGNVAIFISYSNRAIGITGGFAMKIHY